MSRPDPYTYLDLSEGFVHVQPPRSFHSNFFLRTPEFENLLHLSQLHHFSPSSTADNLSTLRELPFSSTLVFTPSGYNWSIRPFVDQDSEDKESHTDPTDGSVSPELDSLPPLENVVETDLRIAFSHLSLRQTGLLHLEPPYNAVLRRPTLPGYAPTPRNQPAPTYFGRTTDSLALREAIDRAIVEYEEAVQRLEEVLSVHIAILRRVERDHSL